MVVEDLIVSMSGIKHTILYSVLSHVASSADLWSVDTPTLRSWGLNVRQITKLFSPELRKRAEDECEFLFKSNVRAISIKSDDYPKLLKQCCDAPSLLYVMGTLDLNEHYQKLLSVVGTRNSTVYGESSCTKLISDIAVSHPEATIVSGLALGIDAVAHRAALANNLKTVAVLAHGLDTVQPSSNFSLAQEILGSGGALVSEYPSNTAVFRHNFIARNRIVAGISAATLLVESAVKGGAMVTASLAQDYERTVLALPGRIGDLSSAGCNSMIRGSKAQLVTSSQEIEYELGWESKPQVLELFEPDLVGVEKLVYDYFATGQEFSSEQVINNLNISASDFYQSITMLELKGFVKSVRGNLYIKS